MNNNLIFLAVILFLVCCFYLSNKVEGYNQYPIQASPYGADGPCIVLFKANYCVFCDEVMPIWSSFVANNSNKGIFFRSFDADKNSDIVTMNDIKQFPTIRFYPLGMDNIGVFTEMKTKINSSNLNRYFIRSSNML